MNRIAIVMIVSLTVIIPDPILGAMVKGAFPATFDSVHYGPHAKQVVDAWLPKAGNGPTPCVIRIHGGGFRSGHRKKGELVEDLPLLRKEGVALVSVEYRLLQDAGDVKPPVRVCMDDIEAAVRFVRSKAKEWNIDLSRLGFAGGSAGACASLCMALANDNAFGVRAVYALKPQTTLDPKVMRTWIPNSRYGHKLFGFTSFQEWHDRSDEWQTWIDQCSPIVHLERCNPAKAPVIIYSAPKLPYPGELPKDPTHAGMFAQKLEDAARMRGVECRRGDVREFIGVLKSGARNVQWRGTDAALDRFFRENDGKTIRRLPSWVEPYPVFMTLGNIELNPGGDKITQRILAHVRDKSGANVLAYSPRCRLDLSDEEFMRRVKNTGDFLRGSGIQFQVQIDPRLFRNEFLTKWPDECLHLRQFAVVKPDASGEARFSIVQEKMWDHTCYGSRNFYSWWKPGRVASVCVVRGGDLSTARRVQAEDVECSTNVVCGRVSGLVPDETLLAEVDFPLKEIDPLSPFLPGFTREIALRYKALGVDGFYMDEFGFQTPKSAMLEHRAVWHSAHFAQAYAEHSGGRDLGRDSAAFALGDNSPECRAAANAYFRTIYDACVSYERFCRDTAKALFGDDCYVGKHPTWWGELGNRREFFHGGLDWWGVPRDWANTDENVSVSAATALSKKFCSPLWLNEGYGYDPKHYQKTMWRYALCGGRMSWHGIVGNDKSDYRNRMYKDPKERRYRIFADMLCADAVRASEILRLLPLVSRAPLDCPVAHVFGHERLMDWHDPAYEDWGKRIAHGLGQMGYYADAYPASELAAGTFAVDAEGFLRVGRQRYMAATLCNLSSGERAAWERLARSGNLKTRVFCNPQIGEVAAYLESAGAIRQTPLGKDGFWGGTDNLLPESNGTMYLTDGTVVRIKGGHPDFAGDVIEGELTASGVTVKYRARGMFAVRSENGQLKGFAGGAISQIEAPGFSLSLSEPADIALVRLSNDWRGVWQSPDGASPMPATLASLTPHWVRLKTMSNCK